MSLLSWKGFQKAFEYINLIEQGMVCTLSLSALTVLFGFILALILYRKKKKPAYTAEWIRQSAGDDL